MIASSKRNHFESADLTATIVWARFSYRYLTAILGMPHVDDRLPFCCKFTKLQCKEVINFLSAQLVYFVFKKILKLGGLDQFATLTAPLEF